MPKLLERNLREFRDGSRKVMVPVDALGHQRYMATFVTPPQIRKANADGSIPFLGHASVFDKQARIGGRWGFWEQIRAGAFAKTVTEADVRFLINHDPTLVLARNKAGTLRLSEDEIGLVADADLAPTSYGLDLAISLERGDITQMSFAFDPVEYTIGEAADGDTLYSVTEARLYDVSSVTYPAYEEADGGLRGAAFDALCRSHGWDPRQKLEEIMQTREGDAEYGGMDDGDDHEVVIVSCPACGQNLPEGSMFCNLCGQPTGAADEGSNPQVVGDGDGARSAPDLSAQRMELARRRLSMTPPPA